MKFKFIVERRRTGFSAYERKNPIFTTGASILELQMNALEAVNLYLNATSTNDLGISPANRLEKLKGNLKGHHSIRINEQWRIIFKWKSSDA